MRPTDKATADSRSVQSFAIIKNTGHVFTLELEMDYPSETSLCTVAPFPTDTSSPIFFWRKGRPYTGYLERIIPSSNCSSKLTDKIRRIVHSKLKLFHFQIKKYYLSDANHQPECENGHFCYKETSRPGLELGVCVSAFAFSQRLFLNLLLTFLRVK